MEVGVGANAPGTNSCYHKPHRTQWGCPGQDPKQSEVAFRAQPVGMAWVSLLQGSRKPAKAPPTPLGPPLAGLVQPISVYYTAQARHAPASGLKTWRQASGWFCAKRLYGSAVAWVPTATWVRGGTDKHRGLGSPWVGLPGLITLPQCECHLATNGPGPWAGRQGRLGGFVGKGVAEVRESGWMLPGFIRGAMVRHLLFGAAFICLPGFLHSITKVYEGCRSVFIWFGHQSLMFCARGRVEFVL